MHKFIRLYVKIAVEEKHRVMGRPGKLGFLERDGWARMVPAKVERSRQT